MERAAAMAGQMGWVGSVLRWAGSGPMANQSRLRELRIWHSTQAALMLTVGHRLDIPLDGWLDSCRWLGGAWYVGVNGLRCGAPLSVDGPLVKHMCKVCDWDGICSLTCVSVWGWMAA